jgi:formate-dependent nitrite reductase membrane component NrfD
MVEPDKPRSYYGRPVIKPPIWKPEIPWYGFFGGLGGASSALGAAASWSGNEPLARRAWAAAFGAISISPVLLTLDLGKPERFLNMLRVFKVTSPMSMGAWLLAANGVAVVPAAAANLVGVPRRGRRAAEATAAILGLPLTTYTAALLSNTVVPVWSEARPAMPVLFASGAASSAGAAALATTPSEHAGPARRLMLGGVAVELVTKTVMERRLGDLAQPYHEGASRIYSHAARVLSAGGAAAVLAGRGNRIATTVGAGAVLAGALCERWAVLKAGHASAMDPAYTVKPQRERANAGAGA